MLSVPLLKNIRRFLDRADLKGPEAIAWCEAAAAIEAEIARLSKPEPSANVARQEEPS